MTQRPDTPDVKKLEAQLLAERQAYYDRVARRSNTGSAEREHSDDRNLEAFLQERLDRLLGTPPAR